MNESIRLVEKKYEIAEKMIESIGIDKILGFNVDGLNLDIIIKNKPINQLCFTNEESLEKFLYELGKIYFIKLEGRISGNYNEEMLSFGKKYKKLIKKSESILGFCLSQVAWILSALLSLPISILSSIIICNISFLIITAGEVAIDSYFDKIGNVKNYKQYNFIYQNIQRCIENVHKKSMVDPIEEIQMLIQRETTFYHEVGETELTHNKGQMKL